MLSPLSRAGLRYSSQTRHCAEFPGSSWKKVLITSHRMSRNSASRTFSGRACSNNLFFLREQSRVFVFAYQQVKTHRPLARGVLLEGHSATGLRPHLTLQDGHLPRPASPQDERWCHWSLWPSRQGSSCPLDSLRLLGQPSSGIPASQSSPG